MKPASLARAASAVLLAFAVACGSAGNTPEVDATSNVRERNVDFETSDGLTLTGRLFGTGRVGVALAHMFPADATSWYAAAGEIAEAGYMVLAFNFRGYRDSEGTQDISKAPVDLDAAREFLEDSGAKDHAFVGASMGGTASIIAAESSNPLAVVAISAPLRFRGLDAVAVASEVARPILLMASSGDEPAMASLEGLARALPNPDTKVFEGDAHGTALLDARPEAIEEIITFLHRYAPVTEAEPSPAA